MGETTKLDDNNHNKKLISCLILTVMFRTAPITYSGEHLPLFATGSNPEGSRATWRIAVCSWTCSRVRGQQWVSLHRGRLTPQGRRCVDIVFGCFERCYLRHGRGDGPINHHVIETAPVIIHLGPLILANVRFFFFYLSFI